jgi:hypothetical protein
VAIACWVAWVVGVAVAVVFVVLEMATTLAMQPKSAINTISAIMSQRRLFLRLGGGEY